MIKTGIIGAGGIANAHVNALNQIGEVEIKGVFDINPNNASMIASKSNCRIYGDVDELLKTVDMVHILTPPSTHKEYALKAMQAGKHVICEKPIAITEEDAQAIVEAAEEFNVKLMVAFNHRFRKGYKRLQQTVQSGRLGEIINFWCYRLGAGAGFGKYKYGKSWRTDPNLVCGMSIESLSHDIDMMRGLVGDVTEVAANTLGTMKELPQFDNNANVVFTLANGGTGLIHASWSSHLSFSARGVIGTKGTAVIQGPDLWDMTQFRIKTEDMEYEEIYEINDVFDGKSYIDENRYFLDCIKNDKKPCVSGEEGLEALKISNAILKSHKDKMVITI